MRWGTLDPGGTVSSGPVGRPILPMHAHTFRVRDVRPAIGEHRNRGEDRDPAAAVRAPHGPSVVAAADEPLSHTWSAKGVSHWRSRSTRKHSPAVPVADFDCGELTAVLVGQPPRAQVRLRLVLSRRDVRGRVARAEAATRRSTAVERKLAVMRVP
jgi:hypothetical protein